MIAIITTCTLHMIICICNVHIHKLVYWPSFDAHHVGASPLRGFVVTSNMGPSYNKSPAGKKSTQM